MSAILELPTETNAQAVLDQIERVVRWDREFRLAFVKCNHLEQQEAMRRALLTRLSDRRVLELRLDEPIVSLLDEIVGYWNTAQTPDAVCVYGLERSMQMDREASRVLARLNHDRDLLRRKVPAALLIWLPDFALDYVARGAPDFWAWRSGVYEFSTDMDLWKTEVSIALVDNAGSLFSLKLDDKRKEIARIEELLRTAQALPVQDRRMQGTISRLCSQLGVLYVSLGEWKKAKGYIEKSLTIAQQLNDQPGISTAFRLLGYIERVQHNLSTATGLYRKALDIDEKLGDERAEAFTSYHLGNVAFDQGDFEQARRWYEKSLTIQRRHADMRGVAATYHQLGNLALEQRDFAKAHNWYQESLAITEGLGDDSYMASTYHQLGNLAQEQRDFPHAHNFYRKSLAINEKLGNEREVARTHHNLGLLAKNNAQFEEAGLWLIRAIQGFAKTDDPQNLSKAIKNFHNVLQAAELEVQIKLRTAWKKAGLDEIITLEQLAQELRASARS